MNVKLPVRDIERFLIPHVRDQRVAAGRRLVRRGSDPDCGPSSGRGLDAANGVPLDARAGLGGREMIRE